MKTQNKTSKPLSMAYERVYDRIISELESGTVPWRKPWLAYAPVNGLSGKPYRGVNRFWLSIQEFDDPRYCTYRNAEQAGWQVCKGAKGLSVEWWQFGRDTIRTEDVDGETFGMEGSGVYCRSYTVFNYSQIYGRPQLPTTASFEEAMDNFRDFIVRVKSGEIQ